jgi:hypothetical protein
MFHVVLPYLLIHKGRATEPAAISNGIGRLEET